MAARQGRISFFGGLPKNDPYIKADSNLIHYRQLHVHGANGSSPDHNKRALEYISTGQVPVKDLITRHVPLDDVMSVFDIVSQGRGDQGHRRAVARRRRYASREVEVRARQRPDAVEAASRAVETAGSVRTDSTRVDGPAVDVT